MMRYGRFNINYFLSLQKLMICDLTQGNLWDDAGAKKAKLSIKAEAAKQTRSNSNQMDLFIF
jgi:hypothetical protein